jgi:hypothetical protein
MAFIPGTTYDIFVVTGQAIFIGETSDPNNPRPPIPGDFNLEVILDGSGTGNFTVAAGYQALAVMATPGAAVFTALHGGYGVVDTGAGGNKIILGDGNESVRGAPHDTLQGGSGNNQFIDGSAGQQLIFLGGAGNESIFGGPGDTIGGVAPTSRSAGLLATRSAAPQAATSS